MTRAIDPPPESSSLDPGNVTYAGVAISCQTCRDCTRPVSKAEPCDLCGQTIEQEREDFPEGIPSAGPSSGWRASDEDRDGVGTEYGIMEANG